MTTLQNLHNPCGTAFGLMDEVYGPGTMDAMKAHGGPYESLGRYGKWEAFRPFWLMGSTYRVKPVSVSVPKVRWLVVRKEIGTEWIFSDQACAIKSADQFPGSLIVKLVEERNE